MKKVMLVLLLFLVACSTPVPQRAEPEQLNQTATADVIKATLHDDVRTFSLVWNQGRKQLIVTESFISLIPNDIPEIPLLSADSDLLKAFLKENREALLSANDFTQNSNPECRDGSLRITLNGIGKTVQIAGCASTSPAYKSLFEKLRELENRYYP